MFLLILLMVGLHFLFVWIEHPIVVKENYPTIKINGDSRNRTEKAGVWNAARCMECGPVILHTFILPEKRSME